MPFPYYRRLSKRDKAIYRKSDSITQIAVPDPERLQPLAEHVRHALEKDDRQAVTRACTILVRALLDDLDVSPVSIRVLATRPSSARSELHGLYCIEPGRLPSITVWMRTAARQDVVKFRTFLRTLFHEVCHHLDYAYFRLADSFHTQGFFRRESSLMRQIVPSRTASPRPKRATATSATRPNPKRRSTKPTVATAPKPPRPSKAPSPRPPNRESSERAGKQMLLPF